MQTTLRAKHAPNTLLALLAAGITASSTVSALTLTEAIGSGKVYGDFRLRYESVADDSSADDASALTLRSRLGYSSSAYQGFAATVEFEDSRIVAGEDEFSVPPTGFNSGQYAVIADPETTELDQAFLHYKQGGLSAKLGRQVITHDGHRFVGHVGWRQDRQTFDALTVQYAASEQLTMQYGYLGQRNRIFADSADINSKDHIVNIAYQTPVGKLVGYAYLLEEDDSGNTLDTYGFSYSGAASSGETKITYALSWATQESETASNAFDADYLDAAVAATMAGITLSLDYEVLGSDDGNFGFATPLATLHKFNGWNDQFLATPGVGLVDLSVGVKGKLGGGVWALIYHDFSADEESASVDDLGSEIDASYSRKFGKNYNAGIKYAAYSAGDIKVDTDKLWLWVGASF